MKGWTLRRKKITQEDLDAAFDLVLYRVKSPTGRYLDAGTEFSISGLRGRFRFIRYVEKNGAAWIDAYDKDKKYRAFRLDRIRTVYVRTRMRAA